LYGIFFKIKKERAFVPMPFPASQLHNFDMLPKTMNQETWAVRLAINCRRRGVINEDSDWLMWWIR
jgi:hypothetical protein